MITTDRPISKCCGARAKPDMVKGGWFCSKCVKACEVSDPKAKARQTLSTVRKPTGEIALLDRLIRERGPVSEIGGDDLLPKGHPRYHWQLFHVLGKGEYPELRLLEENVLLSTWQEQDAWTNRKYTLKDKPHWRKVFALEERLKKTVRHGDN